MKTASQLKPVMSKKEKGRDETIRQTMQWSICIELLPKTTSISSRPNTWNQSNNQCPVHPSLHFDSDTLNTRYTTKATLQLIEIAMPTIPKLPLGTQCTNALGNTFAQD